MRLVAALLLSITTSALATSESREVWLPMSGRAVAADGRLFLTTVAVSNLDTGKRPDPSLFRINYERMQ